MAIRFFTLGATYYIYIYYKVDLFEIIWKVKIVLFKVKIKGNYLKL